jgi:hypothetical protein
LDDLVTTKLNTVDILIELLAGEIIAGLRKQRNNGSARVATNHGDVLVRWVGILKFRDESASTNDIEGGNTKEAPWVVDTPGLENLGGNWDGGVDLRSVSYICNA